MVTATPEGKIPKRKSQITNKSKITNSNSKTESKIWRCDRSNSSEINRHSLHGLVSALHTLLKGDLQSIEVGQISQ